ncbi:hypothetical protein PENSOL_c002G07681 [Penicillium solitum]|uniref:Fe2OG dioxygenase domain-containing protein n=1 Tax=Penicillium solitum TaxID=60172 RepID=A0A1V6RLD2_9EURO|nr:uncharacterized protein PENSOL_c002G07681 [Penicillium solitum]OQE02642.1 hypothetical protein PENSOL_c002G07681 [Penicillium solitum]
MAVNFTSIPLVDYQDSLSPDTKPRFLSALRSALVDVGFFYLQNPPIEVDVREALVKTTGSFFDLPTKKKLELDVAHSKHFRGYGCAGAEKTATISDQRETLTVGIDAPIHGSDSPIYYGLEGPNQWLPEETTPGLRKAVEAYIEQTQELAETFVFLIAEALEIHPDAFTKVLQREYPYSLLRIGAYPQMDPSKPTAADIQGVGPHKDSSFLTYLLQGTGHSSLEAQNKAGTWISVPPIPNTLVVNIGRSLETLTQGVCVATTHRVNLKPAQYLGADNMPLGKRLSFAFFQMVALDVTQEDMRVALPPHILALRENDVKSDAETFFVDLFKGPAGEALLTNCITSYPEMGKRWYPEMLAKMLEQQHKGKMLDDAKLAGKSQTV